MKTEDNKDVILTSPISLEGLLDNNFKPPNLLQLIFGLIKNIRPGTDLTRFQLPPSFNMPKSHLQCFGELVYCVNKDMLSNCAKGKTSIDRMVAVVGWIISTVRMFPFGVAPYNSVLGETHHASRGTLNVLLEQVSHHPPVSALHAIDEANNIELVWCEHFAPKFYGTYVEGVVHGKRKLNLLDKGESYVFNGPSLLIKIIPKTGTRWAGNINVKCKETGLEAQLSFKTGSVLGFGGDNGSLNGKIFNSSSSKIYYEIYGHWDRSFHYFTMLYLLNNQLNRKFKLMIEAPLYVIHTRAIWARSVDAAHTLLMLDA